MNPTYTFMSRSTARPGRFDDLVRIATAPPAALDRDTDGVVAYQVAADREHNLVIVWVTMDHRSTMDDYLASPKGQSEHGDEAEIKDIIATFEMFNLSPVSGRLPG